MNVIVHRYVMVNDNDVHFVLERLDVVAVVVVVDVA